MREFFTTEIPAELRERLARGEHATATTSSRTQRTLNAHGLAVPHWPVEWGGQDWTPLQRHLWAEQMTLAHVPPPIVFNTAMIGPVIATFGSQEIKERFLPKTANADIWWSQGFSEPNAGSDLASLKTTAVRDGDEYIVNGQKTWTTLGAVRRLDLQPRAHRPGGPEAARHLVAADRHALPRRHRPADPPHRRRLRGQRGLLRRRPGAGRELVGEENKGWTYAKFLLGNERTSNAGIGMIKNRIARMKRLAGPLLDDPLLRARLTRLEIETTALEMSVLRVLAREASLPHGTARPGVVGAQAARARSCSRRRPSCWSTCSGRPRCAYRESADVPTASPRSPRAPSTRCRRTSTGARRRSTPAPTRCSAASSPRRS